jgi:hypothetical protein
MKKGIIYFSDNRPEERILKMCQTEMKKSGLRIISVTLKPMDFGFNIVLPLERGWGTYFKQIKTALENIDTEYVFFCEHDCIYPQSHFEFVPPTDDKFYYNQNWVKIDWPYTKGVAWDADQVSGLCCSRELAIEWYTKKVEQFDKDTFDRKFEPGSGTELAVAWKSAEPYVDIRQAKAATKSKWSMADFRDKKTAKNFRETNCPKWAETIIK